MEKEENDADASLLALDVDTPVALCTP